MEIFGESKLFENIINLANMIYFSFKAKVINRPYLYKNAISHIQVIFDLINVF